MKIREITDAIEQYAPLRLQESYDNTGYQVGDPQAEATGALLCVDVTEDIVAEAVERGCNLIISHHPLLFRGLKQVTGRNRPERVLAAAIKAGVTIYSSHTAMDSAPGGISWQVGKMLALNDMRTLVPSPTGIADAGLGVVGNLPTALTAVELAEKVKHALGSRMVRMSRPDSRELRDEKIARVALCGGSAGEFIDEAIATGAQAYVTADCKHNMFLDHSHRILLIDAGHYETEECSKSIFFTIIREKFANFAVYKSEKEKNPIIYL